MDGKVVGRGHLARSGDLGPGLRRSGRRAPGGGHGRRRHPDRHRGPAVAVTYLDGIVAAHRDGPAPTSCGPGPRCWTRPVEAARRPTASAAALAWPRPVWRHRRGEAPVAVEGRPRPRSRSRRRWPRLRARRRRRACRCSPTSRRFGGSAADLGAARAAVALPVLRKDFTVDAHDVCDARLMGADAVLLIVAALDDAELRAFAQLAAEVGLDALVEVHDEAELERALAVGADLVGVNQRDLVTSRSTPTGPCAWRRSMPGRRRPGGRVGHPRPRRRRRPRRRPATTPCSWGRRSSPPATPRRPRPSGGRRNRPRRRTGRR